MNEIIADYSSLIDDLKEDDFFSGLIEENNSIAYNRLNSGIDDRLLEKVRKLFESRGFVRKSISSSLFDYIVIFCDENDLSSDDRYKIVKAKNKSKRIFLIMVCPNKIMNEEHDASGIPDIIELKRSLSGFPVGITIEKKFNANLAKYLELVKKYTKVNDIYIAIQFRIEVLEKVLSELREEDDNIWWDLYKDWYAQSMKKSMKKLNQYCNRCKRILNNIEAFFSEYASDCKNQIAEEKYHKEDVSDFAADLLFKYDKIQGLMKKHLKVLSQSMCMNDDTFALTVNECVKRMDNKPQVSFVGNFSSGKTSYINWLLAMEGNKQLRTSGGHNTAILTYIKKGTPESVLLEYKKVPDKFQWRLLEVEYETEFADVYQGENNAIVTRVDEVNRVIGYKYMDKRKRIVLRNKTDDILVKRNDTLKRGMALTDGAKSHVDVPRDNANVALCDDEEYSEIVRAMKQKKLKNCSLYISYVKQRNVKQRKAVSADSIVVSNEEEILSFINRLRNLEKQFEGKNIVFKDVDKSGFWKNKGVTYLPDNMEYIYNVVIEGECGIADKEEKLSESNWIKYCGTGKDGEDVFSETPRGYLFTKQMTYYLDKGFLNYADIIDTPGLGSTSDEHDDITERYIRKNVSNLLVMLKIDKNGRARIRRKFIYEIAKIYEDSGRDKNNVFFVCNLWSKDYGLSDLKELERICDGYYEDIKECEFNQNNFYVIDIQKMQAGHHEQMMFGKYQSDEIFKESFIKRIADEGIRYQMKEINADILNLFEMRRKYYRDLISIVSGNVIKKEEMQAKLISGKNSIEKICFDDDFDTLFIQDNEALNQLQSLSKEISCITKRKEWILFAEKILKQQSYVDDKDLMDEIRIIEMNCTDDYEINKYKDNIVDKYILLLARLKRLLQVDFGYEEKNPICISISNAIKEVQRIGLGRFPFGDLRDRIDKQSENFKSMIHFIHNAEISKRDASDISSFIDIQIEKSKVENKENHEKMVLKFEKIKEAILEDVRKQIDSISVIEDDMNRIEDYIRFVDELEIVQSRWKKEISNATQMREIVI